MNMREARAYVYRVLAAEVRHHQSNGSEWMEFKSNGSEFSAGDQRRIAAVVEDVANYLEILSTKPRKLSVKRRPGRDQLSGM